MTIVHYAAAFAKVAHAGQVRTYTGEPYFAHVEAVARLVAATGADDATVAAAYLHDTIEDTATTYADLVREFGDDVAGLVVEVTNPSTRADGNRAARKAIDRRHLARASERAMTIKLADVIDNTATIADRAPRRFARLYLAEKALLLAEMTGGDPVLRARAIAIQRGRT